MAASTKNVTPIPTAN